MNKAPKYPTISNIISTELRKVKENKGSIQRVHVKICAQRLAMECDKSFKNQQLPLIPIATCKKMRKWPDCVTLVDIASKGIYLGVKYGYNDTEKLLEISEGLKYVLHDDMIKIIIEYTMEITIKEWILEPLVFINICDNCHIEETKYNQWVNTKEKYDKWVTNIEINDFDQNLQQIIDKYELCGIERKGIRQCFAENDVNYKYLEDCTRRQFVQLLRSDPCNFSVATSCKIYDGFIQYAKLIIDYPFTSNPF